MHLTVRTVEGPGNQLGGANSGYASLPRDGHVSTRGGAYGEIESTSGPGSDMDLLAAHRRALATAFPGRPEAIDSIRDPLPPPRGANVARARVNAAADQQLMTLLRRLTAIASQPGELGPASLLGPVGARARRPALPRPERLRRRARRPAAASAAPTRGAISSRSGLGGDSSRGAAMLDGGHSSGGTGGGGMRRLAGQYSDGLTGLMAVNLIRAHREELIQASTGKLDHMVIDVVGSLFDQILSDSRVPPQMAREIARLQLPVLRVALSDATFFSTRRHPVRRFINRIASLANAFDDFDDRPGREIPDPGAQARRRDRRRRLRPDRALRGQGRRARAASSPSRPRARSRRPGAAGRPRRRRNRSCASSSATCCSCRRALAPLSLPAYLQDFLAQVWSQALVLAVRRDGADSDRAKRYRRVGVDLVMSIQPKGSPMFRKKFLMQLPPLMKDLNEGMKLIGWPEPAQKEFFGKLLPAHAESLKGQPLSELDHNLLVKQLESVFAMPVPLAETFAPRRAGARRRRRGHRAPLHARRSASRSASSTRPRSTGPSRSAARASTASTSTSARRPRRRRWRRRRSSPSSTRRPSTSSGRRPRRPGEPSEPTRGPQLIDHIKLGFAYQMHLKDEWQKVQLAHVSSGRSFFVFTRGGKHQETISMTSRMLARMCETGRFRAVESSYLMERATVRASKQLAELRTPTRH